MSASKKKKSSASKKAAKPKVTKTKKTSRPAKAAPKEKPKKAAPVPAKVAKLEVEKKQAPKKSVTREELLRFGPPPAATVMSRHLDAMHHRAARGFSLGELGSAGVQVNVAKREGLSMDIRRRSVVDGNVELLKGWLKGASPRSTKQSPDAATAKKD